MELSDKKPTHVRDPKVCAQCGWLQRTDDTIGVCHAKPLDANFKHPLNQACKDFMTPLMVFLLMEAMED